VRSQATENWSRAKEFVNVGNAQLQHLNTLRAAFAGSDNTVFSGKSNDKVQAVLQSSYQQAQTIDYALATLEARKKSIAQHKVYKRDNFNVRTTMSDACIRMYLLLIFKTIII